VLHTAAVVVLYDLLQIALALREERALLHFRDYLRPSAGTTGTAASATASVNTGSSSQAYSSLNNRLDKQQQCVVVITVSVPRQQSRQHHHQQPQR
jgi:succinyl-CoA synthetase alpha subunit